MALNIKDERVHEQVRELASELSVSQAEIVRKAVAELYRREHRADQLERIERLASAIAASVPAGEELSDEVLYDEDGLPA
ncbi:type II toxin-antitoxin system VapB family antitoxin [Rothia halotolerans]|uniref:type II toxin-antitoxin system VapB family antitoxin n=1 Tax=Rothia halotolerans TaxID=405770 RepID=UPI00101BC6A5|nr:type II toxin-antitoxin system VapB family antitoxin [Rothia halotolerans]